MVTVNDDLHAFLQVSRTYLIAYLSGRKIFRTNAIEMTRILYPQLCPYSLTVIMIKNIYYSIHTFLI